MRTVLTDVIERADFAIPASNAKQALPGQLKRKIIARALNLTGMPRELPRLRQNTRPLDLKNLRVRVIPRVKRTKRFGHVGPVA